MPKSPDTSHWPTQLEAAVQLATGERTIRRWIDAKRLRFALRPMPGRKPVVIINPDDIARVREEMQPPVVLLSEEKPEVPAVSNGAGVVALPEGFAVQIAALVAAVQQMSGPKELSAAPKELPRLEQWVGLKDAVEYSGLPASYLLAQAKAGTIRAVNVGTGKKAFWRFAKGPSTGN